MSRTDYVLLSFIILLAIQNHIQSRYSLSDPKAQSIVRLITESVQVENLRFLFNLPWTRHLFPEATGWNSQKKITKDVQDLGGLHVL